MAIAYYDVVVIGAGISGLYQLHRLRELGLSTRVYEAGSSVGGTWYWNRYPGARFDSESYSYGYSFSSALLEEWEWSEHFAAQPETLRYLQFVADRLELWRDIDFHARVTRATWDERERCWHIEIQDGRQARARFLVTAIGPLSAPTTPQLAGADDFSGLQIHTSRWPHEPVELRGKRVAVIGTGATGVQVIQEVAKVAEHLTVFQRTPNFCAPLGNRAIDAPAQRRIKAGYSEMFARCRRSYGAFIHDFDPRSVFDVAPAERTAFWERLYHDPGFGIWLGNYHDIFIDREANALVTEFMVGKIRQRVRDPRVAARLIPTNHGFGTRRVPLETGYYEVYNQDNVELVDLRETPIERLTARGIATRAREYAVDGVVYATGFDAVTGAFNCIDFRGIDGRTLVSKWADGPRTLLGLQTEGFPNLLTLVGPHNAAVFCNIPRCIEQNVEWVTELLRHMRDKGLTRVAATAQSEAEWTDHVYDVARLTLMAQTDSWFTGVNQNLPNKKHTFYAYAGGAPLYRSRCDDCADRGYAGFELS